MTHPLRVKAPDTGPRRVAPWWVHRAGCRPGEVAGEVSIEGEAESAAVPRGLLVLAVLAAATVTIAGIRSIAEIVAPVFLALVLTIAAHPLRPALQARGLPRWVGTLAVLVTVYAVVIGLSVSLLLSIGRFATLLPDYEAEFAAMLDDLLSSLESVGIGSEQLQEMASGLELSRLTGFVTDLLGGLLSALSGLVLVGTMLIFLGVDSAKFPALLRAASARRPAAVRALESFAVGTRRYCLVTTVFGLIVAAIDTALLWALGIPAPLLWGLLAFITNFIPNIGFVIGLVPPALLGLLEGGPGLMIVVVVAYCVVNFVIQSLIQPKVVGDAVGFSVSVSFVSLVLWTWALGPLGALLAIPLSLLARALLVDVDPRVDWLRPLIAGRPTGPAQPGRDEPQPRSAPESTDERGRQS